MRPRSLVIGTFLAVCFWGISLLWEGAGNAQRQNQADEQHANDQNEDRVEVFDVLVVFDGEISKQGQMVIQLFRGKDSFDNGERPLDECFLKLEISDEVLWQFRGLPRGEYAIVAYQDVNENWKHDFVDGNPANEKIVFSQVKKVGSSRPAFKDCKFPVTENRVIRLDWK